MEKPFLSPSGVTLKTMQLYLLEQEELETEATLIYYDIVGWILNNFTTSQHQRDFLAGLDQTYTEALGEQTARAVRHRWPIIFDPAVATKDVRSSKWVRSKETDEVGNPPPASGPNHSGSLLIETGY